METIASEVGLFKQDLKSRSYGERIPKMTAKLVINRTSVQELRQCLPTLHCTFTFCSEEFIGLIDCYAIHPNSIWMISKCYSTFTIKGFEREELNNY
jgi:hypothetical protein